MKKNRQIRRLFSKQKNNCAILFCNTKEKVEYYNQSSKVELWPVTEKQTNDSVCVCGQFGKKFVGSSSMAVDNHLRNTSKIIKLKTKSKNLHQRLKCFCSKLW